MTPLKAHLLSYIAECGMLTISQIALMAAMTEEAASKHLRDLFDLRFVDKIAVPYASLAPPGEDGPNIAFGPGQDIYVPTRTAIQYLERAQMISEEAANRKLPDYGPRNALFLAHELLVRDVRVWLELSKRQHEGSIERWMDGTAAHIPPTRPDAWFLFRMPTQGTLVGLVEADRGTERGSQWEKKVQEYDALIGSDRLAQATGGRRRARILVVTQTEQRRERLAEELANSRVASCAFVGCINDLKIGGLYQSIWRHQQTTDLQPLVPSSFFAKPSEVTDDPN